MIDWCIDWPINRCFSDWWKYKLSGWVIANSFICWSIDQLIFKCWLINCINWFIGWPPPPATLLKKEEKAERKGKNREGSFILPLLTGLVTLLPSIYIDGGRGLSGVSLVNLRSFCSMATQFDRKKPEGNILMGSKVLQPSWRVNQLSNRLETPFGHQI